MEDFEKKWRGDFGSTWKNIHPCQTNSNICGDELRDEMSTSISSLHKCGAVLIVRQSIDHCYHLNTNSHHLY